VATGPTKPVCAIRPRTALGNRPVTASRFLPGTETARPFPRGRTWDTSRAPPPEGRLTTIHDPLPNRTGGPAIDRMPTNTRPFSLHKIFFRNHGIRSEPLPMISLEANRRGAFWGAAFRRFSTLWTDCLRVPSQRFLSFWNRPFPIPCQTHPGERGSGRVLFHSIDSAGASSSRARRTGTERRGRFLLPQKII
jgi:hypothetical protein